MKNNLVLASLLSITLIALGCLSSTDQAWAVTTNGKSSILATDAIKNDPVAMKILQNIEISKQRIAQAQQDKKDLLMIEEKRTIAKSLQDKALQTLQLQTQVNSSKNSFGRFVANIPNYGVKKVFTGQYNLFTSRIEAGQVAMKKILDNGGTWEDAMKVFSQYAAIKRIEMVQTNKNLNVQNGFSDPVVQASFDKNGKLPDDYIKVPKVVRAH